MVIVLLVGIGGFIGSVMRYQAGVWAQTLFGNQWIPYSTLAINVFGCLLIGVIAGLAETRQSFSEVSRALVIIGLLGGFTTFSAFGYETMALVREGNVFSATVNVCLQLALGLTAVWIGFQLSNW